MNPPTAPRSDDREGIRRLGELLGEAGYSGDAVERALGIEGTYERSQPEEPLYERMLGEGPFSTFVRLFLLALPVSSAEAARALRPLTLERLEAMGLVTFVGEDVRAIVQISPTEDFLLACDQGKMHAHRPDHVLGYSAPSRVLATLTVLDPVGSALDMGTGNGFQALQAADVARRVVGVDINPRALHFARFNALLNGIENVEFRLGDLFQPVAGEAFDLIVCNPPYVVSPETEYVFRDSGLSGDSFCEALVRQVPAFIADGGHAIVLIAWVHRPDEDWALPIRGWVEGSGCDALLLRFTSTATLRYAATWNRSLSGDPSAYAAALDRWMAYYRSLGIETIAWGGLVLRRRGSAGPNWFFAHSPSSTHIGAAGHHVLRLIAAQDFLRGNGDAAYLLDTRLRLADDHRFEQSAALGIEPPPNALTVLRLDGGLCLRVELDGPTVNLLARLDGKRTLGQAIADLAADSNGFSPERLAEIAVPGIRRLLELGFVVVGDAQ